ncbi:hypothetical protein ACI2JA_03180 [Alkalihalobacillus sp. NPDC078783]
MNYYIERAEKLRHRLKEEGKEEHGIHDYEVIEWLLKRAEQVNWLYGKLNIISRTIEQGREESKDKFD